MSFLNRRRFLNKSLFALIVIFILVLLLNFFCPEAQALNLRNRNGDSVNITFTDHDIIPPVDVRLAHHP